MKITNMSRLNGSLARWLGVAAVGCLVLVLGLSKDTGLLMPGPLNTSHRSADDCSSCHANAGTGNFGWLHALVQAANPKKESATCLKCHTVAGSANPATQRTAIAPHGLSLKRLEATAKIQSKRQKKTGWQFDQPNAPLEKLRTFLVASKPGEPETVYCATCHKEHQGTQADLTAMSNQRCQTCHQVQFDAFDGNHPKFEGYPFRRPTRIKFDHAKHFGDHFKETRTKRPDAKFIPDDCASCHTSAKDKRQMAVKPFDATCSSCHLPQIVGAERATGPKGIALLALPGLDLETLRKKKAPIGEWPELSDAEFSPLMRLLLAGNEPRRALLAKVTPLDLQDLSKASAKQINDVTAFVWEIKRLMHALTTSKASDVMQQIGHAASSGLGRAQISRLLATMPRDVLVSAQREWLPNLGKEIAQRKAPDWKKKFRALTAKLARASRDSTSDLADEKKDTGPVDRLLTNPKQGRWYVNVLGEIVQEGGESEEAKQAAKGEVEGPAKPPAANAADKEAEANVTLDEAAVPAVDAESWSEFGGWYRKDFAVLYKPTGHKDPFMRAWLEFSGARSRGGPASTQKTLPSSVFDLLSHKDAQGQCTKCHSVDAASAGRRIVNWSPSSLADKKGKFTRFVHEPHFTVLDDRGCLTCHEMSKPKAPKPVAKTPAGKTNAAAIPISNFKPVEKKLCATCHKASASRQDCTLCHTYHVEPVKTPITSTRLPSTVQILPGPKSTQK